MVLEEGILGELPKKVSAVFSWNNDPHAKDRNRKFLLILVSLISVILFWACFVRVALEKVRFHKKLAIN